jgi:hypothetical protein
MTDWYKKKRMQQFAELNESFDPTLATGEQLDRIASTFGVARCGSDSYPLETDIQLRARLAEKYSRITEKAREEVEEERRKSFATFLQEKMEK